MTRVLIRSTHASRSLRTLDDVDASTRVEVTEVVRAAFEPFVQGAEVRFTAACWMIGARSVRG